MKTKPVMLRLTESEFEELSRIAKSKGTNRSELLRTYMHECQAGFDRKHEVLLDQLRDVRGELEIVRKLSASTLGSVAMLKAERLGAASIDEVRQNLDSSFGMAVATDRLMSQYLKKPS